MDCNVTIRGNVGSPVAFRAGDTDGRKWARAEFRVASTRRMRRQDGLWVDAGTTWISVEAWGALAEGVRSSVDKGDPVIVAGRLRTDEWHDVNGEVQSRLKMVADSVGHDLSRGRTRFVRNAPIPEPASVENASGDDPAAPDDAREPDAREPARGDDEPPEVDFDALAEEIESADVA